MSRSSWSPGEPGASGSRSSGRSRARARVVVNYRRSSDAAARLVAELGDDRAVAIRADVTDDDEVAALVESARTHFGAPVTTVVNNALADFRFDGDARPTPETITWERFDGQFRGAVKATLATTRATLPGMREAGVGRIVTIGTNLFQDPVVPYHDYTAAKAAALSRPARWPPISGPRTSRSTWSPAGCCATRTPAPRHPQRSST